MANQHVFLNISAKTSSAVTVCVPFADECRLVGARAAVTTSVSSASATINIGNKLSNASVSNWAMTVPIGGVGNYGTATGEWNSSATVTEQKQVYNASTPLQVNISSASVSTASEIGLELLVDPFVTGARTALGS